MNKTIDKDFKWYRNPNDLYLVEFSVNGEIKRYTTSNLLSFVSYLNRRFAGWRYLNVYYRYFSDDGDNRHGQIASYTPNYSPVEQQVTLSELYRYVNLCKRNNIEYSIAKVYWYLHFKKTA